MAVTIDGTTGKLFVNGALVATNPNTTLNPTSVGVKYNYLGRGQDAAGPRFAGQIDELFLSGYALTDEQVAQAATAGGSQGPQFSGDPVAERTARVETPYSASLADNASDPSGDVLTFGKVGGPAWLSVAADGGLSGTPGLADAGANAFTVRVINSAGAAAVARLTIKVSTDTVPPSLSLPADIALEATGPDGAAATYTASATDDVDGRAETVRARGCRLRPARRGVN